MMAEWTNLCSFRGQLPRPHCIWRASHEQAPPPGLDPRICPCQRPTRDSTAAERIPVAGPLALSLSDETGVRGRPP